MNIQRELVVEVPHVPHVPQSHPSEGAVAVLERPTPIQRGYTPGLYANVSALLGEGVPESPVPTIGRRSDGLGLVYVNAVNVIFGSPEAGKTLAGSAIAADTIFSGGSVLLIDIDHNGAPATIARLRSFGVSQEALSDPARFRYAAPEDNTEVLAIVAEAAFWKPGVVLLDSIGELLPMFGANSNDSDDYTRVHRLVLTRLANTGAAVIAIDHEAKNVDSKRFGTSGTAAKKRAIDGVMLRASLVQAFAPGTGGKSRLTIVKDRHGGLRAASPKGDNEPLAATFELMAGSASNWKFWAPRESDSSLASTQSNDVIILQNLTPPPTSIRDVKERCAWGQDRSRAALDAFRLAYPAAYSVLPLKGEVQEYTPAPVPEYNPSTSKVQSAETFRTPDADGQFRTCYVCSQVTLATADPMAICDSRDGRHVEMFAHFQRMRSHP
jgi:hypothetical protein